MYKKNLDRYYGEKLDKYGFDDSRSSGYVNNESHSKRVNYAINLIDKNFTPSRLGLHYLLDFGVGPNYQMYKNMDTLNNTIFSYF